MTIKLCFR